MAAETVLEASPARPLYLSYAPAPASQTEEGQSGEKLNPEDAEAPRLPLAAAGQEGQVHQGAAGREEALTESEVESAAIPDPHVAQMSRFLRLNTDGHANNLVKASVERCEHVLETWRILSKEFDPKGLGTELVELSDLVSPAKFRAKTPAGISVATESWEAMERRVKDRQGTKFDDKIRVTCLLKLVPERMVADVPKQQANWK